MSQFVHVDAAEKYVSDVLSGKIPACKWVKLACKRHLSDIKASKSKAFPFVFDPEKADRACKFISMMPHTKGEWCFFDREKGHWNWIVLEPWQRFFLCSVFGWVKKSNGKRRFTKARIFVPRKNAKTAIMAAAGIYMFACDGEPGAEVYAGATTIKQARELFGTAKQMLLKSPRFVEAKGITINADSIVMPDGSKFEPVIGKPGDGASPHCSITDEYHEHATSELLDTMETGMGARSQPVSWVISTAGSNTSSPCRTEWKHCEKILEAADGFEDETYFAIIYTKDKEDPWDHIDTAIKANPNFGVSIYEDGLVSELNAARQTTKDQSRYKTKKLNDWVTAKNGFFNVSAWEVLGDPNLTPQDFIQYPCLLGCDFAHRRDLTSVMQLFLLPEKKYALFGRHFLPEYAILKPENQHFMRWKLAGKLTQSGENEMDFEMVTDHIIKTCHEFLVEEVNLDPTRMWGMLPKLEAGGLNVVEYRQRTEYMSEPMKELDAAICGGRIVHACDPVLTWAIGNTVTRPDDPKGNVFPRKEAEVNKIDPVVATLFALGRAMTRPEEVAGPAFGW